MTSVPNVPNMSNATASPAIEIVRTLEAPAGAEALNRFLRQLSPSWVYQHPSPTAPAWLYGYWEPGDAWHPLERFVVAEMYPRKNLVAQDRFFRALGHGSDVSKLAEMEGPNPRWGGHYDAQLGRFVHAGWRLPPTITERQWLLWRQQGALAVPVFVLQGDFGTARNLTPWEHEYRRVTERAAPKAVLPGAADYLAPESGAARVGLERELTYRRLSQTLHEDWFTRDEEREELSVADRRLRAIFDEWYSTANEQRAAGQVTDAEYDPATGRFLVADYTTIERGAGPA